MKIFHFSIFLASSFCSSLVLKKSFRCSFFAFFTLFSNCFFNETITCFLKFLIVDVILSFFDFFIINYFQDFLTIVYSCKSLTFSCRILLSFFCSFSLFNNFLHFSFLWHWKLSFATIELGVNLILRYLILWCFQLFFGFAVSQKLI